MLAVGEGEEKIGKNGRGRPGRRRGRNGRWRHAGGCVRQEAHDVGEREREIDRSSNRWVPPVRTDQKIGRNDPCFNIR
jgi:hypothetical protein